MNTEPVSYDSLKTVLKYMEANVRIQISLHIPSIRFAEKAVPLKINRLEFNDMYITVNKTTYRFGIYRKYNNEEEPEEVRYKNEDGGVRNDLDQFGLDDFPEQTTLTLGDVKIGKSSLRSSTLATRNRHMRELEREVTILEESIERALRNGDKNVNLDFSDDSDEDIDEDSDEDIDEDNDEDIDDDPEAMEDDDHNELQVMDEINNIEMDDLDLDLLASVPIAEAQSQLKEKRKQLVPFQCWHNNTLPPFDMYIQVTRVSSDGTNHILRIKYNKKLYETQKCFNNFMFGKRSYPVQATRFHIETLDDVIILRLPIGIKFKIQRLRIPYQITKTCEALMSILTNSSFPLKHLQIEELLDNEDFEHPIFKNAQILVFCEDSVNRMPWLRILRNLTNPSVHLEFDAFNFSNADRIQLIQQWLNKGLPENAYYSFGIRKEETMNNLLDTIKNTFHEAVSGIRFVEIPMSNSSNLKVYYEETDDIAVTPWLLKMKVMLN